MGKLSAVYSADGGYRERYGESQEETVGGYKAGFALISAVVGAAGAVYLAHQSLEQFPAAVQYVADVFSGFIGAGVGGTGGVVMGGLVGEAKRGRNFRKLWKENKSE